MAKRKRLDLPLDTVSPELETKSALPPRARMPIADVAGDTAGRAALEEVARAMTEAETEGRVVKKLALDKIDIHHLNRDRMVLEEEEMAQLIASIKERGQQNPIEVLRDGSRYGLISGLRRLEALRALGQTHVLALVRRPESSQEAYVAMIEENEIRAALSFFERANIVVQSVGAGVYPNEGAAVKGLFARAPAAKRSKILNFVTVRRALGASLQFPTAIPEKLGLALAKAIEADKSVATRIKDALRKTPPLDAVAERGVLERALRGPKTPSKGTQIAPGLVLTTSKGRAVLSGTAVDAGFVAALTDWVAAR